MALSVLYGQIMKLNLLFPVFLLLGVPSWTVLCENQTTGNITDLRNDSLSVGLVEDNNREMNINLSTFVYYGEEFQEPPSVPFSFPHFGGDKQLSLTDNNREMNINLSTFVYYGGDFREPPSVAYAFPHFGADREFNLTQFFILVADGSITVNTQFYLSSLWLTKFVPSVYTLVVAVSLPLNVMAIIVCVFKVKIKAPAVVYMINLAAADVLFVCVLPFNIAYRFSGNNWKVGDGMCRFVTAAFYCNMYCSILLMTAISVDRFVAVVYTMKALTWRTKKRAWLVCFFIWIISIASSLPLLISNQTMHIATLNITTCHDVLDVGELRNFYMYYFSTFSLLFFFLPLVITTVCYIGIIRTLSTKDIENSCKKTRAVILAIVVFFAFLICFGPTNVIFLIHYLHFRNNIDESMYFVYILCTCISSISTCLDPLIYYYASSKYRKYAYSLLGYRKAKAVQSATQNLTGQKELSTENTSSTLY